ncbi:MAG TPA: transporter substrate-binding domain-containing protein [Anaerolineales bacterium]|nr:transporter substrate-binding domain-containing protein [Anaerolineales bacterium]
MSRKTISIFTFLILASLLVSACGGAAPTPAPQATEAPPSGGAAQPQPQTIIETVIVTVPAPAGTPQVRIQVAQAPGFGETLTAVQSRGNLICGVNGQLPGFSFLDPEGNFSGFDADFCRALAAAIFGDPSKVEFRPTTTQERFTVLQTSEIDVLIRNTTWSLVRDTELGLNFTVITFYDGQGIMVPADSGIASLQDLEGGTICVQKGTTTELNLADVMATEGISYTPAVYDDVNATYGAYAEDRCDAVTSDKSQLSSVAKGLLPDPDNHLILDLTLSREPLGPVVRHGDDQWFDIVKWTIFATIAAEEYGISSANIDEMVGSAENPEFRRLLGLEGDLGLKLGLTNEFAYNAIKMVGNYAEIYDRSLGEGTQTFIPRGLNSLYSDGGVLYSPPFR